MAYDPYSRPRRLRATLEGKRITSAVVVRTLRALPHSRHKRTVVVLDNAAAHTSREAVAGFRALRKKGLQVVHLSAYSPELNRVEEQLRIVKYNEMPERTYMSQEQLQNAVRRAIHRRAQAPLNPEAQVK